MKVEFETGDIDRIKIRINVFNTSLVAHIDYDGKEVDNKIGVEFVNALIKKVCQDHSLTIADLFAKGILSIESDKVWARYDYNPATEEFVKRVITKTSPFTVKEDPVVTKETTPETVVVTPPVAVPLEPVIDTPVETEKKEEVKEEKKEEVKEEKKVKTKKGSKRIRNLKIIAGVTALALLGGIVGCELSGGKNDVVGNKTNSDKNNKSKIEDQVFDNYGQSDNDEIIYNEEANEIVVGYNEPIHTVEYAPAAPMVKEQYSLGSNVYDTDMDTQIQVINDECFKYTPNTLYELVYDNDRDALFTIINKRNGLFNGSCSVDEFLDESVNYLFECGLVFDGKQIKSFDSLSPYAQYIVLVATQSVLQLNPEYEHSTPNNNYNYDILSNSFDYMVDSTYRVLTNKGKTY